MRKLVLTIAFAFVLKPAFVQPVINSFTPSSGPVGTSVTITGSNFDIIPGNNIVYFGAVKANVNSATSTLLNVTVPAGATYAPVTVTAGGLTAYSNRFFIITFAGSRRLGQSSFMPKIEIASMNTYAHAVADLDGDGRCDVIASEFNFGPILTVARNTTIGDSVSFAPKIYYSGYYGLTGMTTGDMDGDGKLDVVVPVYDYSLKGVSIYRNNSTTGAASLAPPVFYSVGETYTNYGAVYIKDVAIGDIDGDGKPDIALKNGDSTITVLRNTSTGIGNISFAIIYNTRVGASVSGNISLRDLDGDGKPDIIINCDGDNSITLLRNTSTGGVVSFEATSISTAQTPVYASAGDLDNDGKVDLVVTTGDKQVSIFKNTSSPGSISFQLPSMNYHVEYSPIGTAISDVNGDGYADILVTNDLDRVYIFLNTSNYTTISFDPSSSYLTGTYHGTRRVVAADIDTDGMPDILAGGHLAILRNKVTTPFMTSINPTHGSQGTLVKISGYNFTNCSSIHFGPTSANSFTILSDTIIEAVVGSGPTGVVTGVFPGGIFSGPFFSDLSSPVITNFAPRSGDTGTVVTLYGSNFDTITGNNIVFFGDVKGPVISATSNSLMVKVPPGASYRPITVTCRGLTASSSDPFLVTFRNAPAGLISTSFVHKGYGAPVSAFNSCTADLDGDGKTDIMDCGRNIFILHNTSSKWGMSFSRTGSVNLQNFWARSTVAADINGDGKPDLMVGDYEFQTIGVLRNISSPGMPALAPPVNFTAGVVNDLAVGDVDGDGLTDIVAVDQRNSGAFTVMLNASSGDNIAFMDPIYFPVGSIPSFIELHDLNRDGKVDVIIVDALDHKTHVSFNTSDPGQVSFGAPLSYTRDGEVNTGLIVGDVDNDTLPDIITWDPYYSFFSVLKNISDQGNINFGSFTNFPGLRQGSYMNVGDLDGDAKLDFLWMAWDTLGIFKNNSVNGNISYLPGIKFPSLDSQPAELSVSDLDNDGKPDIILGNSILRNKVNEPTVITESNTISHVFIDSVVQTYNGFPYVQRHYDIETEINPNQVTAIVTLHFTQQEFDNYNAIPVHGTDLPTHPADSINIANLRIIQFHGSSPSGLPGSYSGRGVYINPDDNKIVWNDTAKWWQVTFKVLGFSGFFVVSDGSGVVPLKLLSFTARREGSHAIVEWKTAQEENVSHFILQRSTDGQQFSSIAQIPAKNLATGGEYRYMDDLGADPIYYYRLQIVDKDNKSVNSTIVSIKPDPAHEMVTLSPNPANDVVLVRHPVAVDGTRLILIDMSGRVVKTISVMPGSTQTSVYLKELAKGIYHTVFRNKSVSYDSLLMVK